MELDMLDRNLFKPFIAFFLSIVFCYSANAQDMPVGQLVSTVDCKLNDGVTMAQSVEWARNRPRTGPQPGFEFYRQARINGNFLQNYDFRIAQYFQSFSHMVEVVGSNNNAAANRLQPTVRASDLYTCNPATQSVSINRTANPNNDGFTGDVTVMHTRLCILAEDETLQDAWEFVVGVNRNYSDAGNSSLMQLYNRVLGPLPGANAPNAGRGVVIAAVPSTPQAWGARMDMPMDGFQALRGVSSPFEYCNYPAVWITNATYRAPAQ